MAWSTPWPGATLVSAGGMPLTIHGCACVDLEFGSRGFKTEMVVVSPLTSEAILGIDFLQGQQAVIDLGRRRLCLRESGCDIPLDEPAPMQSCAHNQQVRASNMVKVPPRCIMEISAYVETAVDGVWLVELLSAFYKGLRTAGMATSPLNTSPFRWTHECQSSFDQLRRCSAPVLAYQDFEKPFILDTDASDTGIGGVLSQVDGEGRERVIAYGSRLLTKPER